MVGGRDGRVTFIAFTQLYGGIDIVCCCDFLGKSGHLRVVLEN